MSLFDIIISFFVFENFVTSQLSDRESTGSSQISDILMAGRKAISHVHTLGGSVPFTLHTFWDYAHNCGAIVRACMISPVIVTFYPFQIWRSQLKGHGQKAEGSPLSTRGIILVDISFSMCSFLTIFRYDIWHVLYFARLNKLFCESLH